MIVRHLDDIKARDILCQSMVSMDDKILRSPFSMDYCVLEPGEITDAHAHYESEMFLILSGEGIIRVLEESREFKKGDLMCFPNHTTHQLHNTSTTEPLKLLSIYYEEAAYPITLPSETIIFSAAPTPNGKLHVGHLSGPYLASDVVKRYLNLRGSPAVHYSGADENMSYVSKKARQLDRPNEVLKVAQEYTQQILKILDDFSATPDSFLCAHQNSEYRKFLNDFFISLVDKGHIKLQKAHYPWCERCECFVHQSNVKGFCPYCYEVTDGNNCEACGMYNDCRDLVNPVCKMCDTPCQKHESERYVFSMSAYKEKLTKELASKPLHSCLRRSVNRMLKECLPDVTLTWPCTWGIEAPNLKGQIIFDWVETAAAYLFCAQQAKPGEGYEYFWKRPENKIIFAFGFDNMYCFMGFIPAILFAYDPEIKFPDAFLVNYFCLLEGEKFSTSRNHAIWGDDLLAQSDVSAVRLFLAQTRPEKSQSSFSMNEFKTFLEEEGVKGWDVLMKKLSGLSGLPATSSDVDLSSSNRAYLDYWQSLVQQCELAYLPEQFNLKRVSECLALYRDSYKEYLEDTEADHLIDWRLALVGLQGLAQILCPICPGYAGKLFVAAGAEAHWMSDLDLATTKLVTEHLPIDYFKQQLSRIP